VLRQFLCDGLWHRLQNVSEEDDGSDSLGKKARCDAFTANEERISALA